MKYCELREEEKSELRFTLWLQSISNDGDTEFNYLSADEQKIVDNCESPEDIPEAVMVSAFGCYSFVTEDFFCNI